MGPLLRVDKLNVSFSGLKALVDASITVDAGEIVALIGPNGAGKTTLLNAISGIIKPESGSILFGGEQICGSPPSVVARHGVRRTFQNGGLFGQMSVLENVLVGMHQRFSAPALGLLSWRGRSASEEWKATDSALELLAKMSMETHAHKRASELSGGQQRIVEIIRTISGAPRLLLLDEPAVGLSPAARAQLLNIVRTMARGDGVGVLLIEHAIDLVMELADRIVVFGCGTKIADGPPKVVRDDPAVLEAYLGPTYST